MLRLSVLKDAYASAGILFSGVSACASIRGAVHFFEEGAFGDLLSIYDEVFVFPVRELLSYIGYSPSREEVAFFIFYFAFGSTTVRTFYAIYDPSSEMVVKGVWGRLSGRALRGKHIASSVFNKITYTGLAILLWPIVVFEYTAFYRNIWIRYLDDTAPMMSVKIGIITSNARTATQLMPNARWAGYNPLCDHNYRDDTWYRKEGNFVTSFIGNLALLFIVMFVLAIVSYVTS